MVADEGKILLAVGNLIENAIRFTSHGGVKVGANLLEKSKRLWLAVCVEDTGAGISAEQQKTLFEPLAMPNKH